MSHQPTSDQLAVVRDNDPGNVLVRGAAGSGKTTTALLRLELVTRYWLDRRAREGSIEPVRVLALAFNRTLVGYISDLAKQQVGAHPQVVLEVDTVAGFNLAAADFHGTVWDGRGRDEHIWRFGKGLGFSREFLIDEVEYVIGRFPPNRLTDYVSGANPRLGRGRTPVVTPADRQRIYDEVLVPFAKLKSDNNLVDWNDLAVLAAAATPSAQSLRDIVVVDEAQDFSVNQMRSVVTHLAPDHSVTVVTDTAQRIYPRYLYYPEAGIDGFDRIYTLDRNFRNTPAIAAVAAGVLEGLEFDEDAALPSPTQSEKPDGARPVLLAGSFSQQLAWAMDRIAALDLNAETAAILTLRGHGAWNYTRAQLNQHGLEYVELQQRKLWPEGDANLALSTLHSAKGLEFDHVYILGLNDEFTRHDDGDDDATLDRWRRLLGMAVGRARKSVAIGYKPDEASSLIDYIDTALVDTVDLVTGGAP